jgi:hypothetical protein
MSGSSLFANQSAVQARFLRPGGLNREVQDLRQDIGEVLGGLSALTEFEFVDALAASTTALLTALASAAEETVLLEGDLTTATLTNMDGNPRQLVFTTAGATPAEQFDTATIYGLDPRGNSISETITLAKTAAAVTTLNYFKSVTKIVLAAGTGTGATLDIGIGAKLGLAYAPKVWTAGGTYVALELEDAVASAGGTFDPPVAATSDLPYGGYTPATPANGSLDYVLIYAFDATL